MLIALLMAAQAPVAPAPIIAPNLVSTARVKSVAPNEVCPAVTPDAGIVVQGGLQPSADAGIVVQGGLQPSADAGIVVQGGLQPSEVAGIIVQGGKGADAGIIVQGGKTADAGIIVQGGKTAGAGIIVQGGLQPSAPSESAAREKCDKPKR